MGLRPAGLAVGRESEELDVEEQALDDERQNINMFGHRFLLPFGRRLTQMEMDAAPSPTPSEPDNERRQEDRNMASPTLALVGGEDGDGGAPVPDGGEEGGGDEEMVDLDASIEDMDASAQEEGDEEVPEEEEDEGDGGDASMEEE